MSEEEQPYRILLIEDCSRGMSPTFSQFAYSGNRLIRMNLAANLFDAAHRLEGNTFSLVLLSLRLPDCQGLETLARFQKLAPATPVAVLLQHDEWHLEHDARSMGAVAAFSPGQVNVDEALGFCQNPPEVTVLPFEPAVCEAEAVETADADEEAAAEITLDNLDDNPDLSVEIADAAETLPAEDLPETPAAEAAEAAEIPLPEADAGENKPEETSSSAVAEAEHPAAETEVAPPAVRLPAEDPAEAAATGRAENLRLRKELAHHRAVRQELEGANRALEERCRELEAGQAALIEAEHVAIEREKAARMAAEMRLAEVREQFDALHNVEEERRELNTQIALERAADTRAQELETENAGLREELAAVREQLHAERDRAEVNDQTANGLRTRVANYKQRAKEAEERFQKLTKRFQKLEKNYHKLNDEKKNYEKKVETLEQENREILQKTGELTALYEKAQCERLRNSL